MDRLYVFLIRNDIWIYILSTLGLIWYLTEYWRSRRILKSAIFGLEKEKGRRIRQRSIALITLFLAIIALLTYVNLRVAPTLPPELLRPPTPTPNIFATPLSSPSPVTPNETATLAVAPTVTLAGGGNSEPVAPGNLPAESAETSGTPLPSITPSPEIITGDCSVDVNITSPPDGTTVTGSVTIFGTAAGDQFSSYTLETIGPATEGEWRLLSQANTEPVRDSILGSLAIENWPPGSYFVRLRTVNADNAEIDYCAIELLVSSEPS